MSEEDIQENNLNGAKPTGAFIFYKNISFLDKFNRINNL